MSGQSTAAKLAAARRRIAELEAEVADTARAAQIALAARDAEIINLGKVIEMLRDGQRRDATA